MTQDVSKGIRRYIFKNRTPSKNFKISRPMPPVRRTKGHATMSPPWPYVNVAGNGPVRERHILKTSTGSTQENGWLERPSGRIQKDKCGGPMGERR